MKKLLLISVASFMTLAGWSQSKINPEGLMEIRQYKIDAGLIQEAGKPVINKVTEEPRIKAVVIVDENTSLESVLGDLDVEILSEMDGVAVVSCPITVTEKIASIPEVEQVGFGNKLQPTMNYARKSGNVDQVQQGFSYNGQTYSFDGTGVVVGMMDVGFEANHVNFKNEDGTSRIQRLWHMTGSNGISTEYNASNISSFTTDDQGESHATHVAGIMGGSYKGKGTYVTLTTPEYTGPNSVGAHYVEDGGSMPFYGVATGCDLALSCGELYGQNIVQAVTNAIEYAESVGKPAVVNLSLGSTTGPHDGTDYIPAALARLGKRGIVCISAGNDGAANLYVYKKLGSVAQDRYMRTVLANQSVADGRIDIWTGSPTPVPVQLGYVSSDKQFHPILEIKAAGGPSMSANTYSEFINRFNGNVQVSSSVSAANNRYNVHMYITKLSQKDAGSYLAVSVGGDGYKGQEIYVYGSNVQFTNRTSQTGSTIAGYSVGSPAGSISDDACGENVVSVGAYVTRNAFGPLSEKGQRLSYWDGVHVGDIASFSSYGTNYQGDKLPIVAAPGWAIISSYSRYYISSGKADAGSMSASAQNGNNTDYWGQMSGTSMSCPFTTGTVALWLQAEPTLTIDQIKDVLKNSSTYDALSMGTERWGYGQLDALKGTQYILQKYAANGAVWEDDNQRLVVSFNGSGYDVTMAGEAQFTVTVYDIQGRPVATARGLDGQASVTTSELTPGVYVLAAQGASSRLTRKVTVR